MDVNLTTKRSLSSSFYLFWHRFFKGGSWGASSPSSHSYLPGCPRWGLFNKLPVGSCDGGDPLLAPLGGTSKGPLGAQLSAHHPILAGGTGMAPHPHSAIVGAPFLPGARLPVGSPDDLRFSTSQDFPLPSGNLGLPQCQPQCHRPGREGDFHPPPRLPGRLRRIPSTPSPGPALQHPFPGLRARPLPPQRPLQDLEGTDFSSFLAGGGGPHATLSPGPS